MSRQHDTTPMNKRARGLGPKQYGSPIREMHPPVPVRAWLAMPGDDIEVDAIVDSYTSRAVRIRYTDPYGHPALTWIWASAVRRITPTEGG